MDQGTLTHSGVSYGIIQRINEKVGQSPLIQLIQSHFL